MVSILLSNFVNEETEPAKSHAQLKTALPDQVQARGESVHDDDDVQPGSGPYKKSLSFDDSLPNTIYTGYIQY